MKARRINRYMRRYRRKLIPGRFRCYVCKVVWDKGWSDEEAVAEAGVNFPGYVPSDDDLTCDRCFNMVNNHYGGGWVNRAKPDLGAQKQVLVYKELEELYYVNGMHGMLDIVAGSLLISKDMEDLMDKFRQELMMALRLPKDFFERRTDNGT